MLASLPMYDRPETRAANDRFWQAIRDRLGAGPARLSRGNDPWEDWLSPNLVLSQTCGFPYRERLHGRVTLVGTPDHGLAGCPPGHYRSVLVARANDPRDDPADFAAARLACNDTMSQSGWAAPRTFARSHGFRFGATVETGAHRDSALAVAAGRADIAALDAVSWLMMRRYDGFAASLKEVGRTAPTPALPYITAAGRDPAPLHAAIAEAIAGLSRGDRETLSLRALVGIPARAYLAVPAPPAT